MALERIHKARVLPPPRPVSVRIAIELVVFVLSVRNRRQSFRLDGRTGYREDIGVVLDGLFDRGDNDDDLAGNGKAGGGGAIRGRSAVVTTGPPKGYRKKSVFNWGRTRRKKGDEPPFWSRNSSR